MVMKEKRKALICDNCEHKDYCALIKEANKFKKEIYNFFHTNITNTNIIAEFDKLFYKWAAKNCEYIFVE